MVEDDSVTDPQEVQEWIDSIRAVIEHKGADAAASLLSSTISAAQQDGVFEPRITQTTYQNTIRKKNEPPYPGSLDIEARLHNQIRWNAMMMVSKANKELTGIGGHISTYASQSHLWEVGFNHHFLGKDDGAGDHVYFQGHASPGIYARAWFEGRFDEEMISRFRQESNGPGLSSYPHPRLMPDFWEYPTVSMGLGALTAIRQARFNKYLSDRGLKDTSKSHIWYFMGDGESDEPESLSDLAFASKEGLDNITITVSCNLQRLDGPVRGNQKIIQELEGRFAGAGWDVIKLLWGSSWDPIFAADSDGLLQARLESLVDGDEQRIFTSEGEIIREELFNSEQLKSLVSHLSDEQLESLVADVGGHDPVKINAAFTRARASDVPTVILARTVKGWGLGPAFAGRNTTHQKKKAETDSLQWIRDDMELSFSDEDLENMPFITPEMVPEEVTYLRERRQAMGGFFPQRTAEGVIESLPSADVFAEFDSGTRAEQQVSTTMAFVRLLSNLLKSEEIGARIVPIIPDEARTFGMDPLFSSVGIYSPLGQLYKPVDHNVLMKYKESKSGQMMEEGINEAGALSTFIASGMSYATHSCPTIPFYVFYSMFGFQRVADLIWSAADSRTRGFLIGATSGRTTLNGEGLQHQDGHSLLMAHTNPAVRAWDPAFAYETAAIIKHGLEEMYGQNKDVIHYIAVYNENHPMPAKPEGVDEGIIKGAYLLRPARTREGPLVRLLGSGPIMLQAMAASEILESHGVRCEIWSVTSYGELRREAKANSDWNLLNKASEVKVSWAEECFADGNVTVAVSDNIAAVPDLIREWIGGKYIVLGTDGFGRSDTRDALRQFFRINAEHVALAALSGLVDTGVLHPDEFISIRDELSISGEDIPDVTEI